MTMMVQHGFKQEFSDLMASLKTKYGDKLFDIDGIGKQLDVDYFARTFFNTASSGGATADVSIDANANVTHNDAIAFRSEMPKAIMKLNSYYRIWKTIAETNGKELADSIIDLQLSGALYINDVTDVSSPYCWNFSCMDIAMSGLPMVTKIKCGPPKHLTAFKSQIEQFLNVGANSVLGATGLADLLIVMAYYVDRVLETGSDDGYNFRTKKDVWKYVESLITSLVYTLNQPARAGLQSAFTNISMYDSAFLGKMVDGYVFLDGKRLDMECLHG